MVGRLFRYSFAFAAFVSAVALFVVLYSSIDLIEDDKEIIYLLGTTCLLSLVSSAVNLSRFRLNFSAALFLGLIPALAVFGIVIVAMVVDYKASGFIDVFLVGGLVVSGILVAGNSYNLMSVNRAARYARQSER